MESIDTKVIIALIAVFVSFIGLLISKEQKTSEFRQVWINTLRNDISNFIGQVDYVRKLIVINKTTSGEGKKETSNTVLVDSVKMKELESKITLLINPKEKKHQELVTLLDVSIKDIIENPFKVQDYKELTLLSQEILKEEWKRVKDGELVYRVVKGTLGVTTVITLIYAVYTLLCS